MKDVNRIYRNYVHDKQNWEQTSGKEKARKTNRASLSMLTKRPEQSRAIGKGIFILQTGSIEDIITMFQSFLIYNFFL